MGNRQMIDLSIAIENDLPSDPPHMIPKVAYADHNIGAQGMLAFFQGLTKEQLPDELGWAMEDIHLTTHSGTHLDAPYHYHPKMSNGQRAITIDEVPLDWCYSDGVVLDFSQKRNGEAITTSDVENELARIEYTLKPLDIVLVHVGADKAWGKAEYLITGAGMTRESTLYLLERGIKVVGIDAWSWDRPLPFLAEEFKKNGDPSIIWEAHFAGIEKRYCHMEKMANLDKIPRPHGFKVACFPINIKSASAGWTRPVAIIED